MVEFMNRKFKTVCSFFVASMLCIPCISTTIKAEENYNVNDSVYSTYSNNLLKASNTEKTKICQFKLKRPNAIQNFDFGQTQNEIYVTQNDKNNTTYLSRCTIKNNVATAENFKPIKLEGYGHGESLEVIPKSNGQTDIWVGDSCNIRDEGVNWSTTISKITYDNSMNKKNKIEISGFNNAIIKSLKNETEKTKIKKAHRFRINVAVDDNNVVGFRVVVKDANGVILAPYYLIYESNVFDVNNTKINLADKTPIAIFQIGNSANKDCGYNSFQGFDLTTSDNEIYIYTYSGAKGNHPIITKHLYNKNSKELESSLKHTINSTTAEAEGIKIIGKDIYVGFNNKTKENNFTIHDGIYKLDITTDMIK